MKETYNKPNSKDQTTMIVKTNNTTVVRTDQYKNFSRVPAKAGTDILKKIQEDGTIVLGAGGHMGANIADACNRASTKTQRVDISEEMLAKAKNTTIKNQEMAAKLRKLSQAQLVKINIGLRGPSIVFNGSLPVLDEVTDKRPTAQNFIDTNLSGELSTEFKGSKLAIEALPEILSMKQNQFGFYIYALKDGAILATNTSSLEIDKIAQKVPDHLKHRVVGLHFFDPADRNPLVEIIAGTETSIESVLAMRDFTIAMGKMPIVSWGDSPLAIANRILVGVLNEAAHIASEGTDPELIDKVFLRTFYPEQIDVKVKKAQKQFEAAPKLGFFKDERGLYKQILEIDSKIQSSKTEDEKSKLIAQKKGLLIEAFGRLNQKVIYADILDNSEVLGSFFTPPPMVATLKANAKEKKDLIKKYSDLGNPFPHGKPYDFPKPEGNSTLSEKEITDRLKGAYIVIAQEIYLEGLGTPHDIELACKEGFKWNIGPFELLKSLPKDEVVRLTTLVNERLPEGSKTGISKPGIVVELNDNALSGVQTYTQDGIGHIILGRRHIQFLSQSVNSINPEMLDGIRSAVKKFESDPSLKAIFFESQGGGPFSAGADLNYINDQINWDTQKTREFVEQGYSVIMNDIYNCKKPTVAILDGVAFGGGAELASACDYRIGSYDSGVSFPEVNKVKIYPGWGGDKTFPAIVGKLLAEAIMVPPVKKSGLVVLGAQDAYDAGFLDKLVLQSEIPHLKTALITGKIDGIDIYKKPPRKANYDKKLTDYTYNIVSKYNLDKLSNPKRRITTRFAANLTRRLIEHSRELEYKPTERELRKVLRSGWLNSLTINFAQWFSKSIFAKSNLLARLVLGK